MGNKIRIIVALALFVFLGYVIVNSLVTGQKNVIIKDDGSQLVRIKEYYHTEDGEVSCAALDPACGWCPGEVIEKSCYAEPEIAVKYNNQ